MTTQDSRAVPGWATCGTGLTMVLKREVDVGLAGLGDGGKESGNFLVRIILTLRVRETESFPYLFHQDQMLMTQLLHS